MSNGETPITLSTVFIQSGASLDIESITIDNYAEKLGLDDRNIFNAPVTIIDPKYDDDDNRLITTIFNPYEGAEFLNYKRKEWEKGNKKRKKM